MPAPSSTAPDPPRSAPSSAPRFPLALVAGIIGKLRGVLEGKSGGALTVSRDDQRRDLDDLAFTAGGRTGVPLRAGDVPLRRGAVSPPFAAMTASRACSIALIVMTTRCAGGLTRG